jgi:hypothetical protein
VLSLAEAEKSIAPQTLGGGGGGRNRKKSIVVRKAAPAAKLGGLASSMSSGEIRCK